MMTKTMKDLRANSDEQLDKRLADMRGELIKLNAQTATGGTPKNPMLVRNTKTSIARVLTLKRERELAKMFASQRKASAAPKKIIATKTKRSSKA